MVQKGSSLLRILSILMILGAILGLLGCISIFALKSILPAGSQSGLSLAFTLIGGVGSVLQLVSGILGLQSWRTPAKAKNCLLVGLLTLVLALASNIYSLVSMLSNAYLDVFSLLLYFVLGLVLPALFVLAALQLYRQAVPARPKSAGPAAESVPLSTTGSAPVSPAAAPPPSDGPTEG